MARITAGASLNNTSPAGWYGTVTYASSTELQISDGYNTVVYLGSGFTYDWAGRMVSGTLNAFGQYAGNQVVGYADGFAIAASTAASYISSNNLAGVFSLVQAGRDEISGSPYSDVISGYGGNDFIDGGGGDDIIFGGAGDDVIYIGPGYAYASGDAGFDIVELPGFGAQYYQTPTAEGWQFRSDQTGTYVNLDAVERVGFEDGVLAFDTAGNAGQMYRLYQAAFARDPDAEGLGYWIKQLDAGNTNITAIADSFLYSPEFVRVYGTPTQVSNGDYVELLYLNALGRQLDSSGYNYWVGKLETGQTNRSDLLAFFAESDENKAQTAGEISDGIWFV